MDLNSNDDYNHNFIWFYRGVYRFGCRGGGLISTPALLRNRSTTICGFRYKINWQVSFGSLTSAIKLTGPVKWT